MEFGNLFCEINPELLTHSQSLPVSPEKCATFDCQNFVKAYVLEDVVFSTLHSIKRSGPSKTKQYKMPNQVVSYFQRHIFRSNRQL